MNLIPVPIQVAMRKGGAPGMLGTDGVAIAVGVGATPPPNDPLLVVTCITNEVKPSPPDTPLTLTVTE